MTAILASDTLRFKEILNFPPLAIERGEVVFITGRSGSGKSTLLKMFNGIYAPDEGAVYYNGTDISELDTLVLRKEVLLAAQGVFLFSGTIHDNFAAFYDYRELPLPPADKIEQFLQLCCMDFPLTASCNTMSGGERQRIYLAMYLSFCPQVLMLDEPTSALDTATANRLLQNLRDFARTAALTLLIISHDPGLAEKYADRVIDLGGGI